MPAPLSFTRRAPTLLRRALNASRAFSDAAGSEEERKRDEAPLVFARQGDGKGSLRYYVLKQGTNPALAMLESSAMGTPMPAAPGARPRFARLPPPNVCNSVLARAVEDASFAVKAAEVAEALLLRGVSLEPHTLKALFGGLARAKALPEALPVLDAWLQQQEEELQRETDVQAPLQASVMTQLLDTATRAEDTQLLLQVLSRMARIGSLTTLLQCFMRLGQVSVAHQVLDWMRRNKLEPNVYSYTALLALPRDGAQSVAPQLLLQALTAYDKMREDGVAPNARFFTELIRICGRAGDMRAAEAAWRDARAAGVAPDLILYSAMIDACAKCADAAAATRVYEDMRGAGVLPDVVTYTSLLTALQGAPQAAARARELWRRMRRDGVAPNGLAVAAFLEILLLEEEIDEALQVLAEAQPGGGAAPRAKTFWQRRAAQLAREAGFVVEEEEAGGPPGAAAADGAAAVAGGAAGGQLAGGQLASGVDLPRLYEHFIFAMAHKGQYEVVEQMARHMRSRGLPHTLGTVSALLTARALQRGATAAKWLLQPPGASSGGRLAASLLLPDPIVEACLLGRASPQACMRQLMVVGGGKANRAVANVVLAGLAVQGCTAEAVQLFEWMQQQGQSQQGPQAATGGGSATGGGLRQRSCSPDGWTRQLLLYAALNAPREQQLELTLRAVREARGLGAASGGKRDGGGNNEVWDKRTRGVVLAVMRQSERARELLGGQRLHAAGEEQEERLRQLRRMLR